MLDAPKWQQDFCITSSSGKIRVLSAGSEPTDSLNPGAVSAMAEEGIDISQRVPELLAVSAVEESDVVITMGCGDACPIFPGKRYEDWELADPAGLAVDDIRPIRDDIKARVLRLISELLESE